MVDRELTGDEAQRALSEAMRRTLATVPDPTPAELIAFVQSERIDAGFDMTPLAGPYRRRMFSALLTVLEGRRQEVPVPLPDAAPSPPICSGCDEPMQKVDYRCGMCGTFVASSASPAAKEPTT